MASSIAFFSAAPMPSWSMLLVATPSTAEIVLEPASRPAVPPAS